MIQKILPFLNKLVPAGIAYKGLEKVDPNLRRFFKGAFLTGFSVDQAVDFLRNKAQNANMVDEEGRILNKKGKGSARPDELATLQKIRKQKGAEDALASGVSLGAGAAGGILSDMLLGEEEPTRSQRSEQVRLDQLAKARQRKPSTMQTERDRFNKAYPGSMREKMAAQEQQALEVAANQSEETDANELFSQAMQDWINKYGPR